VLANQERKKKVEKPQIRMLFKRVQISGVVPFPED
jgi:hypothetical protein